MFHHPKHICFTVSKLNFDNAKHQLLEAKGITMICQRVMSGNTEQKKDAPTSVHLFVLLKYEIYASAGVSSAS